eukprot:UN23456
MPFFKPTFLITQDAKNLLYCIHKCEKQLIFHQSVVTKSKQSIECSKSSPKLDLSITCLHSTGT